MKPPQIMVIAGEASGDTLAAELVGELRKRLLASAVDASPYAQPLHTALAPQFFGAGGPRMAAAGVDLAFDLTAYSVFGPKDVLFKFQEFRSMFKRLFKLAVERQPDAIICVDYGGFNCRFAAAIKEYVRPRLDWFHPWDPKVVQFVSPQVWASRAKRMYQIARDYDLLLSIFPFEKEWYAQRAPALHVEFVGHPMLDRYRLPTAIPESATAATIPKADRPKRMVLLPGSRRRELKRHLPVIIAALDRIRKEMPGLEARMVLPNEKLVGAAKSLGVPAGIEIQEGGLAEALTTADLAIASSGTVTVECAFFGVPTVVLYKLSWPEFQLAKRIVTVPHIAMPNLLAGEALFPEFIQGNATPANVARAALELLQDESRRARVKARLAKAVASLGGPGACARAADAIISVLRR